MRSKLVLLSTIAVSLATAVFIAAQRSSSRNVQRVEAANVSVSADSASRKPAPFIMPPRPAIEVFDSSSAKQVEIATLRATAFDLAESTVNALPRDPEAICLLGKLHLRSGNAEAARRLWDHALTIDSNFAEAYLDYGNYELNLGNYSKAVEHFRRALESNPQLLEAHKLLADAQFSMRDFEQAARTLETYLEKVPSEVASTSKLGAAYQQLGKTTESIAAYSRALQMDPESSVALQGLASAHRAAGNQAEAKRFAEEASQRIASVPRVAENRADSDPDLVKAIEVLDFVSRSAMQILVRNRQATSAAQLLENAKTKLPTSDSLRSVLIDLYIAQKAHDNAISLLNEQTIVQPDNAQAWMRLGAECLKTRKFDQSDVAIRRVIALQPANAEAYALLAQTQLPAHRDPEGAISSAKKAVELAPTASNHFILGTVLYFTGDAAGSKSEIQKAVELEPENAEFRAALERL